MSVTSKPRAGRRAWAAVLLAVAGCRGARAPAPEAKRVSPGQALAESVRTSSAAVALGNLDADIAGGLDLLGRREGDPRLKITLCSLMLTRCQVRGWIADCERAEALAEQAVAALPNEAQAWMARAAARGRMHRFVDALADLDRARALGATGIEPDLRRASSLQAMGRFAEARALRERWAAEWPRLDTLAGLAGLDADEGDLEAAEAGYARALEKHGDVSPFPVVWLWTQQGAMWLKAERLARAEELAEAAHVKVPEDVGAASLLATVYRAMGEREKATALLREVVARSEDPEHLAQLADALSASPAGVEVGVDKGPLAEAIALRASAAGRFDAWVARHPEAFADHAARFYLGGGGQPERALSLAEQNLSIRRTPDAFVLTIEASLRAGRPERACALSTEARGGFPRAKRVQAVAWRAYQVCGRAEAAEEAHAAVRALASRP